MPLADETAALLACGDAAVLSHLSAAKLWRIVPEAMAIPVHVTIPRRQAHRPAGVHVHRTAHLEPRDVRIREALPLTSPIRTLIDVAEDLADRELERALDEALVRRLVRERDLGEAVAAANGRRGAPVLGALLERRGGSTLTRSQAEELFLTLIRAAQLPQPEVNARVFGYEVDFFWPKYGLVMEIDGYAFHGTRGAFERDRRKDARLRAAGISNMRVTWRQMQDEPYAAVARLAQAMAWEDFRRRERPAQTAAEPAPGG